MENIFRTVFSLFKLPVAKADDELIDPQTVLREECGKSHCTSLQDLLDQCTERVNSKKKTSETCSQELLDYIECVDHCVAKTLFSKLK